MQRHCDRCSADFDDELHLTMCPHIIVLDPSCVYSQGSIDCIDELMLDCLQDLSIASDALWRITRES